MTPENTPPGTTHREINGAPECPHRHDNGESSIRTIILGSPRGGFYCTICEETFEERPDEVEPVRGYVPNGRYAGKRFGGILR